LTAFPVRLIVYDVIYSNWEKALNLEADHEMPLERASYLHYTPMYSQYNETRGENIKQSVGLDQVLKKWQFFIS
jgi:hypothetical protein